MCSLSFANATIALEAKQYEQASNAPLSFLRVGETVSIVCRLVETNKGVIGNYLGTMVTRSGPIHVKHSAEILNSADITKAETAIFAGFASRLQSSPVPASAGAD